MTENTPFNTDNLQTINIEAKQDFFDELNLPPQFAAFCRKNANNIKIGAICLALALTAWAGYDYYTTTQIEKSTSFLAAAMNETVDDLRADKLAQVIANHSGSDAALWGMVELGHADQKAGHYQKAIDRYNKALDNIDEESPMAPLLHFSLAQAFELNKDDDNAIIQYQAATAANGFADMGYMALGRIYEKKGETIKARDAYEKITKDESGWAKERLATLIPATKNGK